MALAEAEEFMRSGTYPIVRLETPFVDERGSIQNLTTKGCHSAAIITSQSGTSRASHVHRSDDHLAVVMSGCIEYWWQDALIDGDKVTPVGRINRVRVTAGQAFYTPSSVAHTMYFLQDTVFITISCKARDHESHEADLIRVPSLREEYIKALRLYHDGPDAA